MKLTIGLTFIALVAHCATETDTETYGTASTAEVASSSTGPMVNSPEKDAGTGD